VGKSDDEAAAEVIGCGLFVLLAPILLSITGAISGALLRYVVNYWLVYVHRPPAFPFLAGFVMGAIPYIGGKVTRLSILLAIATYIASFFV